MKRVVRKIRFVGTFLRVVTRISFGRSDIDRDMEMLWREHLEAFHYPTDSRLDYCACGESWPCTRRRSTESTR